MQKSRYRLCERIHQRLERGGETEQSRRGGGRGRKREIHSQREAETRSLQQQMRQNEAGDVERETERGPEKERRLQTEKEEEGLRQS